MIMNCCNHTHPYDDFDVQGRWQPSQLRCLIIGENPGGLESAYFYDPPENYQKDPVIVRKGLLSTLSELKLLYTPTLEGFRQAGFLFDHAIRCPMTREDIRRERQAAQRYKAARVQKPDHLRRAIAHASIVWVMGHLACNAVANLTNEFSKKQRRISAHPYPGYDEPESRFFVSEYLTWRNKKKWTNIGSAFAQFARLRWDWA
ncbi:MAG: hypothetical protein OXH80_08065 [Nitrospira sp.]|nr:hypothetical protein [Nitrospira sp.]